MTTISDVAKRAGVSAMTVSRVINGKTLPKNIDTGYYWFDKTNINNPEIQAVLYK